jgi:hypothetical protein
MKLKTQQQLGYPEQQLGSSTDGSFQPAPLPQDGPGMILGRPSWQLGAYGPHDASPWGDKDVMPWGVPGRQVMDDPARPSSRAAPSESPAPALSRPHWEAAAAWRTPRPFLDGWAPVPSAPISTREFFHPAPTPGAQPTMQGHQRSQSAARLTIPAPTPRQQLRKVPREGARPIAGQTRQTDRQTRPPHTTNSRASART